MEKRNCLIISLLIAVVLCCLVGCKKTELPQLDTPSVTINVNGVANWQEVENAIRYVYKINDGREVATDKTSVQLKDGQNIKVKAVGDRSKFRESGFSDVQIYRSTGGGVILVEPNIKLNGYTLTWNRDKNAVGYSVSVTGVLFNPEEGKANKSTYDTYVDTNSVDLYNVLSPETEYDFNVKAIVTDGVGNSQYATLTTEKVTKGLSYTLNDDGGSYTVDSGTASKSGRIVFPDMYKGKPVTVIAANAFGTFPIKPVPNKVTGYRLPLGLIEIGDKAFSFCNVSEIILPAGLKKIGDSAFYNCPKVTKLDLPEGLEEIGESCFYALGSTKLVLPDSLSVIGTSAFRTAQITDLKVGNNIQYIGDAAFSGTPWLKNQPEGMVFLGNVLYAYAGVLPDGAQIVLPKEVTVMSSSIFINQTGLKSIDILGDVQVIPAYCFVGCVNLQYVSLPDTVTMIDRHAFKDCVNLKEIELPSGVTSIGDFAFYGTGLTSFVAPTELSSIGRQSFYKCLNLGSFTVNKKLTAIGGNAFSNCESLTDFVIPEGVETIENGVFSGCNNLNTVKIPSTVKIIGERAFYGCKTLSETLNLNITEISGSAFEGCESIRKVVFGSKTQIIGEKAFYGCIGLAEVNNSEGLTNIKAQAFFNCTSLLTFYFGNKLTAVRTEAFYGCEKLRSITNDSVATLYPGVFKNCKSLESFKVNDGVKYILSELFYGCSSLKSLIIPTSVTTISMNAFTCVNEDFVIYYEGNGADSWKYTSYDSGTPDGTTTWDQAQTLGLTVYFYSATEPTKEGNYWYYDNDGKIVVWIKNENQ